MIIIIAFVSVAVVSILVALVFKYHKKKTKNEFTTIKSALNELEKFRNGEIQRLDPSMLNGKSIQNISNEDDAYPEWLKARKEMLFSSNHLERGDKLGNGKYGSVYKGKLFQGKSV